MSARITALTKRVTALAGAVALTAAALLAGAGAATAATVDPTPTPTPGPGNVNFDAKGSIIVHKHEQPNPQGEVGDGSDLGVLPGALEGVPFTVEQLDIDLTDPAAWDQLEGLQPGDVDVMDGGYSDTLTTDGDGIANFTGLPVGVYLVTEGDAPAELGIVNKAAPFIVVVPTSINDTWTYDVHAYPKNTVSKLEKVLDEEQDGTTFGQGEEVRWNVTSTAPTLTADDVLNKYEITDNLDSRLSFVGVENVMYGGEALDAAYYEVVPETGGQTVTLRFTEAGRAWLAEEDAEGTNNSGKDLTFDIVTKVVGDIGDGVIVNEATQLTNFNDDETDTETPSNEDETYWGNVNILKQDEANQLQLSGAEFQVFRTAEDAAAGENPIAVNGETTFTTDENGVITISSLNVGADGTSRTYYIKETKAPEGYVLDETVHEVVVVPGANSEVVYTIDNMKQDRPDLPLTGATGTIIFVAAGAALVAIAFGLASRNQRRARA
ncbi:SpaH/EbpB family LPXTG-anchored major pilin [Gulosibacter hominis]|uniref:SpaH/EbpB family LPXTG-anchored major pilin n=1 Tax=Gulosibacter hominis TaxID=2770504 RepID=UPI001918CF22|nr:SpaH/EbpB family LPXTG-anchored major pilin [Gulosibacter hominis]